MKLNYRDKIIAGVLLAIIILLVGFFVPVKNQIKKNKADKATLAERQEVKADYEKKIAQIPKLQESIRSIYNSAKDTTKIFVPVEDVENQILVDKYLQKCADDCHVRILNLDLKEATVSPIDYYFLDKQDKFNSIRSQADINGNLQAEYDASVAGSVALSQRAKENVIKNQYGLKIIGTKKNIWKYLEAIKKIDSAVVINSVNISDFTFGKDAAKKAGTQMPDSPEDGAEVSVQVEGKEIKNTSDVQIVISIYSVIEMEEPDVELK